jgi:hypothetical protein
MHRSINGDIFVKRVHTYSALLHLLRRDPENRENFDDNLDDYIHHLRGRPHFCVNLKTSKKHLNALKDVDKSVLACSDIFNSLGDVYDTMAHAKSLKIRTERRSPTPANITLAGENNCNKNMRKKIFKRMR